ncbi:MAG: hypothetical protein ACOXZV_08275 [Bacteroidales bacterium]|mgnify:CR=1 FL=1|jgi:hypothetical protein
MITEESSILKKANVLDNQRDISLHGTKTISTEKAETNPVLEGLAAEGGENFYHYINWLGLSKDPNLMILSSIHHYYYDFNDLKGVKTLINLKQLNQVNHLDSFLNNVYRVLPAKANFIGCFKDNKIRRGIAVPFYQSFRFLNGLINVIDSRTDRFMSRKYAIKLLESHKFRIVDMTEIGSLTYFCAQNAKKS